MNENRIKAISIILYYIICPCLLGYFVLIDLGYITPSLIAFGSLGVLLLALSIIIVMYKKKNNEYKFEVNKMYEKVMCILVLCELAYNFSK